MEKVFSMKAGQGDSSYAQNSTLWQRNILLSVKAVLEESIRSWKTIFECETLRIADLGCSSGPNALFITETIITEIRNKYAHKGISDPEFQVFYNDLPATDFNTLFRLLSPPVERSYLVAGVPGSFYTRLFPSNSLHFVHSSLSLHWLSQVPKELRDRNSECWNKGQIFISEKGSVRVVDAYFAQFQKDFNAFLRARAKEMVVGGRMFVVINCHLSANRLKQGFPGIFWEMMGVAINVLVSKGMIEEEKLDSFNLPFYAPSPEEVRSEVQREGSFTIVEIEIVGGWLPKVDGHYYNDKEVYAGLLAKQIRAALENLISHHFGESVIDTLFHTYEEVLAGEMDEIMQIMEHAEQLVLMLDKS